MGVLNEKRCKTSFRTFPIINYQRYNKYDNDYTFNVCIEILKKI